MVDVVQENLESTPGWDAVFDKLSAINEAMVARRRYTGVHSPSFPQSIEDLRMMAPCLSVDVGNIQEEAWRVVENATDLPDGQPVSRVMVQLSL